MGSLRASREQKFNLWLALGLIVLLGLACYINCLGNEMFWDDDDFILKNRFIKDPAWWPFWFSQNMVAGSYLVSNYWRPALLAVFSFQWHLWHDVVYGWHIVSVLVHTLDGVVLFFLLTRLLNSRVWALSAALLFVAHPVHNEAVVYVNSLGDSQSTFFVLSSLLLFTRFRQSGKPAFLSRNYLFAFLCFPLGLLSKETGFVLCALLPLTDFLLLQADRSFLQRVKNTLAAVWPFLLLALLYVIGRATILNFSNSFNFYNENNAFTSNIFLRLLTFFKAMTQYTGFLFFPYELRVERALPWAKSLLEWDVLLGASIVGAMLWMGFTNWRKKPWVSFGIGWFFIAILPASNILVPINAVLYEHFLYVPMIGIAVLVTGLSLNWAADNKARVQLFWKILILVLVLFAAVNLRRNLDWRTAITFYEKLAPMVPESYRVWNNLGMEYADKGFNDKAIPVYRKVIAMDPTNPVAYHNLAGSLRDTGHIEDAISNFKKALELNPNFIFTYRSLAELYWRMGNWKECRENLLQILRIDSGDTNIQRALADVERRLKN